MSTKLDYFLLGAPSSEDVFNTFMTDHFSATDIALDKHVLVRYVVSMSCKEDGVPDPEALRLREAAQQFQSSVLGPFGEGCSKMLAAVSKVTTLVVSVFRDPLCPIALLLTFSPVSWL
jgi:hypothetical protein